MANTKTEYLLEKILKMLQEEKYDKETPIKVVSLADIMRCKKERIKCTYNLNPSLLENLNIYCKQNEINQSDVVNKALFYFLEQESGD